MGELGLNKIFGALLAVALAVMGLREVSTIVFGGGHHGTHEYASLNEWAAENFHGYRIDIAEVGGGATIIEEIYDLGALLAAADLARGERSFKGKCATCHTLEEGGASILGPNLYAIVGEEKQHLGDFAYSGALGNTDGTIWTYENLDAWIEAPSKYARGTSMAFAGISRDDERTSLIAYLASFTPEAPAFPEPLPEIVEDETVEGAVVEDIAGDAATTDDAVLDASAPLVEEAPATDVIEDAAAAIADEGSSVGTDLVEDATDAVAEVTETVEETVEDATAE